MKNDEFANYGNYLPFVTESHDNVGITDLGSFICQPNEKKKSADADALAAKTNEEHLYATPASQQAYGIRKVRHYNEIKGNFVKGLMRSGTFGWPPLTREVESKRVEDFVKFGTVRKAQVATTNDCSVDPKGSDVTATPVQKTGQKQMAPQVPRPKRPPLQDVRSFLSQGNSATDALASGAMKRWRRAISNKLRKSAGNLSTTVETTNIKQSIPDQTNNEHFETPGTTGCRIHEQLPATHLQQEKQKQKNPHNTHTQGATLGPTLGSAEYVGSESGLIVAGSAHGKLGNTPSCQSTLRVTTKEKQSTDGFHHGQGPQMDQTPPIGHGLIVTKQVVTARRPVMPLWEPKEGKLPRRNTLKATSIPPMREASALQTTVRSGGSPTKEKFPRGMKSNGTEARGLIVGETVGTKMMKECPTPTGLIVGFTACHSIPLECKSNLLQCTKTKPLPQRTKAKGKSPIAKQWRRCKCGRLYRLRTGLCACTEAKSHTTKPTHLQEQNTTEGETRRSHKAETTDAEKRRAKPLLPKEETSNQSTRALSQPPGVLRQLPQRMLGIQRNENTVATHGFLPPSKTMGMASATSEINNCHWHSPGLSQLSESPTQAKATIRSIRASRQTMNSSHKGIMETKTHQSRPMNGYLVKARSAKARKK